VLNHLQPGQQFHSSHLRVRCSRPGEQGFLLLACIFLIAIMLLALSIAAPRVAWGIRHEREVESTHRAQQYVRGIQLYYRKFGHYPTSIDQLKNTNNIRFLRKEYPDPMTGKPDWRLIHLGESKTTIKGFFGEPLAGLPGSSTGLGSISSMLSNTNGASGSTGSTSAFSSSPTSGASGATGSTGSQSSTDATTFSGSAGPIVGISSVATGGSIIVVRDQTTYQTWEFTYDPRVEQLMKAPSLFGGAASVSSTSATSFGSTGSSGSTGNPGVGSGPGSTGSGSTGPGNSGPGGIGSGPGSSPPSGPPQ